jgi:hypothetical protein
VISPKIFPFNLTLNVRNLGELRDHHKSRSCSPGSECMCEKIEFLLSVVKDHEMQFISLHRVQARALMLSK